MPELPENVEEEVSKLVADSKVSELTPLQSVFKNLTWFMILAVLLYIASVVWIYCSHMPPTPPLNATSEEMSHYRELTEINNDNVKNLMENVFSKALYPILGVLMGFFLGRQADNKKE